VGERTAKYYRRELRGNGVSGTYLSRCGRPVVALSCCELSIQAEAKMTDDEAIAKAERIEREERPGRTRNVLAYLKLTSVRFTNKITYISNS
jgi:hypothetical protein